MSIKQPALKYYGSKFRLAKWIIEHFPKHRHYVEPFGGAANVLLVKPPSPLETYNDLDDDLVNFFRVLREERDELIEQIWLTPWARTEFDYCCQEIEVTNPIEKARRLFVRLWMSISGGMIKSKLSFRRHNKGWRNVTKDLRPDSLFDVAARFRSVLIENRDAIKLILEMDSPDTLFYVDPPYLKSTRTAKNVYSFELTDDQHRELELLRELKGLIVLSGYPSEIYTEIFEKQGWVRHDKDSPTNGGSIRTESLWLSPSVVAAGIKLQEDMNAGS